MRHENFKKHIGTEYMKIGLYPLVSNIHDEAYIDKSLHHFKKEIEGKLGFKFRY